MLTLTVVEHILKLAFSVRPASSNEWPDVHNIMDMLKHTETREAYSAICNIVRRNARGAPNEGSAQTWLPCVTIEALTRVLVHAEHVHSIQVLRREAARR